MAQKGISTQEEATGFQGELSKLASNLEFHVNCVLDKAHGIEFVSGFIDEFGNDRRVYLDDQGAPVSHGNPSLPNFIRFVVDGVAYYAPCLIPPYGGSDPGGQPHSTGIVATASAPVTAQEVALVTDYVLLDTAAASGMEDYIIEHSRQTHQIAHSPLMVVPVQTFRSNGALIGNFRIRIPVGGNVYEIPCDTRIGGMVQPVSVSGYSPGLLFGQNFGTADTVYAPIPDHACPTISNATKPIVIAMEYQNYIGNWIPFGPTRPPNVTVVVPSKSHSGSSGGTSLTAGILLKWDDTTGCVQVLPLSGVAGYGTVYTYVRAIISNPVNSVTTAALEIIMAEDDYA